MDSPVWHWAFWFTTILFLAAIGMQLNVLLISTELKMVNPKGWTFGQIVAITVWIPPLLEYIYREMKPDKHDETAHGDEYEAVELAQG